MNQSYEMIKEELSRLDGFVTAATDELHVDFVKHNDLLTQLDESKYVRKGNYNELSELAYKAKLNQENDLALICEKEEEFDLENEDQTMQKIDALLNMIKL